MEDGITLNRAADNLLVSAKSVRRWRRAAFQDTTNLQGHDIVSYCKEPLRPGGLSG